MKPAYFGLGAKEFVNVDDHCIHLSARVEHHCLGVCPVPEIRLSFVAIKMGRRQGARRAHIVTDPAAATQPRDSRRPIFIATLWAAASWLFFHVARSSRIDLDMIVTRALKNSQLTCGEKHAYFGDRTLDLFVRYP